MEPPSSSSINLKCSESLSSSSSVGPPPKGMAGFADLVNLNLSDETCPVTRGRRIQVSKLAAGTGVAKNSGHSKSLVEESGSSLRKRWSFHSATQITEIMKEDVNIRPILSPKRRKSSTVTVMRSHSDAVPVSFSIEAETMGRPKLGEKSQSSSHSRSSTHNQSGHHPHHRSSHRHHHHHRRSSSGKALAPRGENSAAAVGNSIKQRFLSDEYLMRTEEPNYPQSYHQFRMRKSKPVREPPPDYISRMPDEVLLRIFKFLPKPSLANLGRTSHRFLRLIEDESLWKRLCIMNRLLEPEHLLIIMQRKPMYLRMARAEIPDPIEFPSDLTHLASSSQLTYLDLSCAMVSPKTLALILRISPKVIKLSLEHLTVTTEVLEAMMGLAEKMEVLNLTMCYEVDPATLAKFLSKCQRLREFNMGCLCAPQWARADLTTITSKLPPTLRHLNIAGFRGILDNNHVEIIVNRCPDLLELDASDSAELNAQVIDSILKLEHLEHLCLSRCYGIDPPAYCLLTGHKTLKYLDLFSLFKDSSLKALSTSLPKVELNKFPFSAIGRPTFGNKRSSIWLQRVRD